MGMYRLTVYSKTKGNKEFNYDKVIDGAVVKFGLNSRSKKAYLKDMVHYLLIFWKENKHRMRHYKTLTNIAHLLGLDNHATIIHYVGSKGKEGKRKKSFDWIENTKHLAEWIRESGNAQMRVMNDKINYNK